MEPLSQGIKKRTSIQHDSLNPRFNESFDFPLSDQDLTDPQTQLFMTIYDEDYGKKDDLIGIIFSHLLNEITFERYNVIPQTSLKRTLNIAETSI